MKVQDPELSAKWWSTVRPSGMDDKKRLEKALAKTEKALGKQQKKPQNERAVEGSIACLKSLPDIISKVIKKGDKKEHQEEIRGLRELKKLVDAEVARLEQLKSDLSQEQDEDDEDEGKLFDKRYVRKQMKRIKSNGRELSFAFGLDTSEPEACDLLLHRKKSPGRLFKILKRTKKFPNRLMCFGKATADPHDKQTLLFKLGPGSRTPPQRIVRIVRKFFQADRQLRFRKLRILAPGRDTFEDVEPEREETPEFVNAENGVNESTA